MKVRVAINALTELTAKYGSRVYLLGLAEELAKCDSVELILLVGKGQTPLLPKVLQGKAREIDGAAPRSFAQFFLQRRIRAALAAERIDVYHLPNTLPFFGKSIPTVVSIHDLADLRVRKYGPIRTAYRWMINYCSAQLADHVLTLSENSKRDLVRLLGIPAERVTVTFAGVHDRFRRLNRAECKSFIQKSYGISSDFLLAPGGLSRNKNVTNLLLAYAQLRNSGIQLPLILTGHADKKDLSAIQRQVRKLLLDDFVILTGYVDAREMPFFYGACSVVLYPSLYEGFGLPVVESMASGAPLVVSNTSSLPEIVGDAAIQVDPRDPGRIAEAVRLLLTDEQLRSTFVARGLARAALFSWQKVAGRVIQVYQDILRGREQSTSPVRGPRVTDPATASRVLPIEEDMRES